MFYKWAVFHTLQNLQITLLMPFSHLGTTINKLNKKKLIILGSVYVSERQNQAPTLFQSSLAIISVILRTIPLPLPLPPTDIADQLNKP
jgi:hypothetical protein